MAIAPMAKVMIVCHRSQVSDLLEALQDEGICQILSADEAAVSKATPELTAVRERPRDVEELVARLARSLSFLKEYSPPEKGLASALSPRRMVARRLYEEIVTDNHVLRVLDRAEQLQAAMDKSRAEIDRCKDALETLRPWVALETPVEEIGRFRTSVSWAGLVPTQHYEQFEQDLGGIGAAVQEVGPAGTKRAVIVVALRDSAEQVQKLLRSNEVEVVGFETMTGTAAELVHEYEHKLAETRERLEEQSSECVSLAENLLKLHVLHDHYRNVLGREQAGHSAPATEQTKILEGWCKARDYDRLEQIVSRFSAAGVTRIEPTADEEPPVEIENTQVIRPFEVVTRLYGMPQHVSVDPTPYLAPFFAVFFGMCIADAGYGLLMLGILGLALWKMQGDKKLILMLGLCAVATVVIGALTGGWFGDAVQKFVPGMEGKRTYLWFDPFQQPLLFFGVAVGIGYVQLVGGLVIALVHNIRTKAYLAALLDQVTWIVLLNSLVLLGLSKAGLIPMAVGSCFGLLAIVAAVTIFLGSHREGGLGARLGMGFYNVFSSVFYLGDVLSYLRLMALGMVGAGLAMAINVMAQVAADIPWVGRFVAVLIFVGGHVFNLVLAILSAFVHTLRLQYVEFFPKFLLGGGREFTPLAKDFEHIYIEKTGK